MDFKRLYIFGAGGHGREIVWLAEQIFGNTIEIVHLVDQEKYLQDSVNGKAVHLLSRIKPDQHDRFVVALGDSLARKTMADACQQIGLLPATLVHPRVEKSSFVEIGEGSVICAGSVLTTNIKIGQQVHVNIACTVSHDVSIGNYATLSPGVHVAGHVNIGRDVFIGTGASIINGSADVPLVIGDGARIAAGACVTQAVAAGTMVAGVPAVRKS